MPHVGSIWISQPDQPLDIRGDKRYLCGMTKLWRNLRELAAIACWMIAVGGSLDAMRYTDSGLCGIGVFLVFGWLGFKLADIEP